MQINRRNFIKSSVAAGLAACTSGALLGGCTGSLTRADIKPIEKPGHWPTGLDERMRSILFYASLAPSGHNTQPWFVRIKEPNRLVIGADPKRRLPTVDPANREVMLSIGAFAENLALAADSMGLKAHLKIIAANTWDQEIIDVTVTDTAPTAYPLERITRRMTVKQGYLSNEIKRNDIEYLSKPLPGRLFYFPRGTQHGTVLEIKGQGLPNIRTGRRGSLLAQVLVEIPRKLNKQQEKLLREFAETEDASALPESKGFFQRVKDYFANENNNGPAKRK